MSTLLGLLFRKLPTEASEWSHEDRRKWLIAAIAIFDVAYKGDDSGLSISVTVEPKARALAVPASAEAP